MSKNKRSEESEFFPAEKWGGGATLQEMYAGIALQGILAIEDSGTADLLKIPVDIDPNDYSTLKISKEQQLAICDRIATAAYLLSEALVAKFEENMRITKEEGAKRHKDLIKALKEGSTDDS